MIRIERESVVPILKPKLIMHLAGLIGTYSISRDDISAITVPLSSDCFLIISLCYCDFPNFGIYSGRASCFIVFEVRFDYMSSCLCFLIFI